MGMEQKDLLYGMDKESPVRTKQLFFSLALGLGLTLALLWLLGGSTPLVHADSPHHVASDCAGVPVPCYTSIQVAVDAAVSGDEILVATGTYTDVNVRPRNDITTTGVVTQAVYISKTLTIRGGYTTTNWTIPYPITQPTTLDAQGRGRVLYITGDISPTIEGLRITGGNTVDYGGGVYIIAATATISNNQVFSNTAHGGGGLVLAFSAATLHGNTISNNVADGGGGLDLVASNATLSGNIVTSNTSYFWGGGLYVDQGSNATLINNVVADNRADSQGSALYIRGSSPRLLHTTIARNSGGEGSGVYVTDYVTDDGFLCSTVVLTNTILVSHTVGITVTGGNTVTVNGILWYGTPITVSQAATASVMVQNQHEGAPAFPADGYHLTGASAAIDRGVNAGVMSDIDDDARPDGCFFDIGADEFITDMVCKHIYLPLIMRQYQ